MNPAQTYALYLGDHDSNEQAAGIYYAHVRAYEERALNASELYKLMEETRADNNSVTSTGDLFVLHSSPTPKVDTSWYDKTSGPASLTTFSHGLVPASRKYCELIGSPELEVLPDLSEDKKSLNIIKYPKAACMYDDEKKKYITTTHMKENIKWYTRKVKNYGSPNSFEKYCNQIYTPAEGVLVSNSDFCIKDGRKYEKQCIENFPHPYFPDRGMNCFENAFKIADSKKLASSDYTHPTEHRRWVDKDLDRKEGTTKMVCVKEYLNADCHSMSEYNKCKTAEKKTHTENEEYHVWRNIARANTVFLPGNSSKNTTRSKPYLGLHIPRISLDGTTPEVELLFRLHKESTPTACSLILQLKDSKHLLYRRVDISKYLKRMFREALRQSIPYATDLWVKLVLNLDSNTIMSFLSKSYIASSISTPQPQFISVTSVSNVTTHTSLGWLRNIEGVEDAVRWNAGAVGYYKHNNGNYYFLTPGTETFNLTGSPNNNVRGIWMYSVPDKSSSQWLQLINKSCLNMGNLLEDVAKSDKRIDHLMDGCEFILSVPNSDKPTFVNFGRTNVNRGTINGEGLVWGSLPTVFSTRIHEGYLHMTPVGNDSIIGWRATDNWYPNRAVSWGVLAVNWKNVVNYNTTRVHFKYTDNKMQVRIGLPNFWLGKTLNKGAIYTGSNHEWFDITFTKVGPTLQYLYDGYCHEKMVASIELDNTWLDQTYIEPINIRKIQLWRLTPDGGLIDVAATGTASLVEGTSYAWTLPQDVLYTSTMTKSLYYHSAPNKRAVLRITLDHPIRESELVSAVIFNRTDDCCKNRLAKNKVILRDSKNGVVRDIALPDTIDATVVRIDYDKSATSFQSRYTTVKIGETRDRIFVGTDTEVVSANTHDTERERVAEMVNDLKNKYKTTADWSTSLLGMG